MLLKQILPRIGIPEGPSSDNGPHFISQIVQEISRALQIKWDLHTTWRLQSSGQVERMNQTLKRQLIKICQESQLKWPEALPISVEN